MAAGDLSDDELQLGLRLPDQGGGARASFDFATWARAARFDLPDGSASLFERIESAAEAYLLRDLLRVRGALHDGGHVHYHGAVVRIQVPAGPYRIDFALQHEEIRLAVEVDGLEHHGLTQAQFARDYHRARRLMIGGYIVVRFTASEAMTQPRQCWRDTFAILKIRSSIERSA
jgi:very-short-patch-repair endonuclease